MRSARCSSLYQRLKSASLSAGTSAHTISSPVPFFAPAMAGLPDFLVDELDDAGQRLLGAGRVRVAVDEALRLALVELELDLAARLAIGGHEAVELRTGMRHVLGALEIERGGQEELLAALEGHHGIALGHGRFRAPVRIVMWQHAVDDVGIGRACRLELLRVVEAAERVDDGP